MHSRFDAGEFTVHSDVQQQADILELFGNPMPGEYAAHVVHADEPSRDDDGQQKRTLKKGNF